MLELNPGNAAGYLLSRGLVATDRLVARALGGGVSNTVLLVEAPGRRMILKQSLAKLRVEQDWFSERERIFRESAALRAVAGWLPEGSVPRVLWEDRENYLFAMTAA